MNSFKQGISSPPHPPPPPPPPPPKKCPVLGVSAESEILFKNFSKDRPTF